MLTDLTTVRGRLTAWYSGVLAATLLVLSIGALVGLKTSVRDTVDRELRARLPGMNEFLVNQAKNPDGESLADELREQAGITPAGAPLRIADPTGRWLYESRATKDWGALDPTPGIRTLHVNGEAYRILTEPVIVGTLQLGAPLSAFNKVVEDFTWTVLLASPGLLILSGIGGYWLSGRALAPVETITKTAQEINAQDLSLRLPVRGSRDELDRLSETLNGMFARLETAFRRITDFTADASHELRTPVAVIRTTAELTRSKPRTNAEYEKALDSILAESEHTTALIEDLLLLARADSPGQALASEPLDLMEVAEAATQEATVLANARGVRLTAALPEPVPFRGDHESLRRMLLALLDNAVKYTPSGGTIRLTLRVIGSEAEVTVRDSGTGIAPEDLPHLFERFYRASKDRRRDGGRGGAGLGLSIAQWIARQHRGEISVVSLPGEGAQFLVRLPLPPVDIQNPGA